MEIKRILMTACAAELANTTTQVGASMLMPRATAEGQNGKGKGNSHLVIPRP